MYRVYECQGIDETHSIKDKIIFETETFDEAREKLISNGFTPGTIVISLTYDYEQYYTNKLLNKSVLIIEENEKDSYAYCSVEITNMYSPSNTIVKNFKTFNSAVKWLTSRNFTSSQQIIGLIYYYINSNSGDEAVIRIMHIVFED